MPGLRRRRACIGFASRMFFALAFIRWRVEGRENIPDQSAILVANHASYLDGIVMQAFMPDRFCYVIKGEVQKVPVLHFVLKRIGSKFVDRHVKSASSRDARKIVKAAMEGECLGVFPEGTFTGEVGLGRFRAGAFVAAVKSGVPVVPVVIRGSRGILPSGTLLPRPGSLEVEIRPAIFHDGAGKVTASELAAAARESILEKLGEPDLAG